MSTSPTAGTGRSMSATVRTRSAPTMTAFTGNRTTERAGSHRRCRLADELPDQLGKLGGLVEGNERVAAGDLRQAPVWEQPGQALAVLGRHDPVLAGPDHKRGPAEGRQRDGGVKQQPWLGRDRTQHPDGIAADRALRQDG